MIFTQTPERHALMTDAVEAQSIHALPARAALSLVNANLAAPINAALAANVLSDNAAAGAGAAQTAPINQGMLGSGPTPAA
jgi:hypothetical protein